MTFTFKEYKSLDLARHFGTTKERIEKKIPILEETILKAKDVWSRPYFDHLNTRYYTIDVKLAERNLEELKKIQVQVKLHERVNRVGSWISEPGKLLEKSCEKCGRQEVYCGQDDSKYDLLNNYHEHWHLCLGCLDTQYVEHNGNSTGEEDCPYCK